MLNLFSSQILALIIQLTRFSLTCRLSILSQSYSSYTLTFRTVSSAAFKTAINKAIATLLGASEDTIVTSFNAEDCRFPVAGTYHCYLVVYSSFASYDKFKSILARSSTPQFTAAVLSKSIGLPITVTGYQFEQPSSIPTTIPLPAAVRNSSSKIGGEILKRFSFSVTMIVLSNNWQICHSWWNNIDSNFLHYILGIDQTNLIIIIVVVSVSVFLLICFCVYMRSCSYRSKPNTNAPQTHERKLVAGTVVNVSRPEEVVTNRGGKHHQDLAAV